MTLETLWGNKVDLAIARIRSLEPRDGYWLAFSGGKDSQCIYHLAVEAGVRWGESTRRAQRGMVEGCTTWHKSYLHPIIDWSEDDVWSYHSLRNLPHCELYDEGRARIGCVLCPMNSRRHEDIERWPRIAANYRRACERAYARRLARGDTMRWKSGADMYAWWLGNEAEHGDLSDQMSLFA